MLELLPPELLTDQEKTAPEAKAGAKTRVPTGRDARDTHAYMRRADRPRSNRRALVKAMVDGARPFPADQSGMANINFLDGRAIMVQSGVPFYALFNGVRNYAEIKPSFAPDDPDHELWGDKISRRFHNLLSRWNGFDWNVQQASYWMRLHGTGPCYFDKPNDWRFRAVETGAVLVPDGTASCVDDRIPLMEVVVPYRAHELYGFYTAAKDSQGSGWDLEALKCAIRYAIRNQSWVKSNNGTLVSWETIEQRFNNSDLNSSITGGFLNCVHQLFKEWDGKISKVIFSEDEIPLKDGDDTAKDPAFLFQSIGCYDNYEQCMVVFFKDIGDGTWHSVKGYASDAFDTLVVGNQMLCQMIDAARVDSTIILEFPTTQSRDKMDKFRIQRGITKLPVGAKIVQGRMQGAAQGAIQTEQLLRNKLLNNIGNFQGRGMSREDGKGETVTAAEVDARVAKESSLDEGQMTLFYGYLDHLYEEMYRRASDPDTTDEEAERFQKECEQDGVPLEALRNPEWVRANRESGYGSPAMRQQKLTQLQQLEPRLPTDGQQNLLDMQISAIVGPDKVALLNPREHQPDLNDWAASIENGAIEDGINPPLISGQNDTIHLHVHLEAAAGKLEPIKQALDAGQNDAAALQEAYEYTQTMGAHCELHIGRLMADPARRQQAEFFKDTLAHIVSFSGNLRGAIINAQKEAELAAEQQRQATALSALDQAHLQSVQTHDQIAAMKAATSIRDKSAKAANDIRIKQLTAAVDIQTKRATAAQPKAKAA